MLVQFISNDTNHDTRYDADESVCYDTVLYGKHQKSTRCLQRTDERKQSEHETDDHTDAAPCRNTADNRRDVQNGRIHDNQGNETVSCKAQKDGNGRQKTGNRKLPYTHELMLPR